MESLRRLISRRPGPVVAAAILVAIFGFALTSRLSLETELVALLPEGAPEATDYRRFLELFGGFEKVFVLLLPSGEAAGEVTEGELLEAAEELAEKLAASDEVRAVRSGLEPEDEEFFLNFVVRRSLLLVPESKLDELEERLRPEALERRAAELRAQLTSPAGSLQTRLAIYDPLGFASDLPLLTGGGELPVDPFSGAFVSRGGDAALLVLTPALGELDAEGGRRLLATLDRAFAELEAARPEVECRAIGGPLYAAQDETAVRGDMEKTVLGSVVSCTAILILAFGGLWIPTAAVVVLAAAFGVTGATLALGLGSVTAVGLGFAAVLVGLGIDYAIHGATRFRQARLDGAPASAALGAAYREAGPGIATSALTTAVAFATLGVAHFRPLRELGVVVAAGIVAILLSSATLGAALLVLRPGRAGGAAKRPGRLWRALDRGASGLVAAAERRPWPVLVAAAVVTGLALFFLTALRLDPDLSAMRPSNHPVFETERLLVERFGLGVDTATVVLEGESVDALLERAEGVEKLLEGRVEGVSVLSPADWLIASPAAARRLERLEASSLAAALPVFEAALRSNNLASRAFAPGLDSLRALGEGRDPGAPASDDWPEALAELLRVGPGGEVAAALRLRLPEGTWAEGPPAGLLEDLEALAPGAAVASVPRLGVAMKRLASQDLQSLAALGALLVALVVGVSFRGDLRACLIACLPVTLGTVWALGAWGALGRPLDLLSLSVVPILLGIGIDDGLHAVHGARLSSTGDPRARPTFERSRLASSVAGAGLAISLTTLTTCAGFGSLAFSSIPGLARGGLLVSIGVAACLLATLLVLPALGSCGRKRP